MNKKLKAKAFHSYFGGKNKMSTFIVPFTPIGVKTYVEPFSGSFAVYFYTPFDDDVAAIYNDFNKDQANLFYCAKDYDKFLEKLDYHMNNDNGLLYCESKNLENKKTHYKALYYDIKKSDFSVREFELGDYDRACMYVFLLTSAFNSVNYMAGGFSGFNKTKMKLLTFINKLKDEYIRYKLDRISEIESMDFEELILKYDSTDTYFYIDPPYFTESSKKEISDDTGKRVGWYGSNNIFDEKSHERLCKLLKNVKGKWALSYYDFEKLHEWLPETEYIWKKETFFRSSASFADTEQEMGTELLIMNYKLSDDEIEENKKFLNVKTKNVESDSKKVKKELGKYLKNVLNNDFMSEKLIDEIEEENGGAFINSNISEDDKNDMIEEISDFISRQKNLDPDTRQIVNENFSNMIDTINDEDAIDDDDFWNS
jgi:DNA adenine methylase